MFGQKKDEQIRALENLVQAGKNEIVALQNVIEAQKGAIVALQEMAEALKDVIRLTQTDPTEAQIAITEMKRKSWI